MEMLKLISVLMSYPRAEMLEALDDMANLVERDAMLAQGDKAGLSGLIDHHRHTDLLDLQQQYVDLFDRGRNLSLHLFEHIHGESRDRGQAMVDLMNVYQANGFEIAARELPDYIPMFLEYLSQRPKEESIDWLRGAMPVLALLGARLGERGSANAVLFQALCSLVGETADTVGMREQVAKEGPDETLEKMDEIWEEEAVSFMGNPEVCRKPAAAEQPVVFHRHQPKQRRVG
jgi:nitrate reductase delta subunit